VTYEPPAIERRAEVGGALIGVPTTSGTFSPAWRRPEDAPKESA
jgi:hypothetical protein